MESGRCTRLKQGAFKDIAIYSDAPEKVAAHWQGEEASFPHLVDLNSALAGYSANKEVTRRIADTVSILIGIGGGIRSRKAVECMLGLGVRRVIVGIRTMGHPEFPRDMVRTSGKEAIVTSVDTKDGVVAVGEWEKVSSLTARDLCLTMKGYGVRHVAYTDISKNGMLSGPNVGATRKPTEGTGPDIIASGGISCMEDLKCLYETGIRGTIIGKALYENRIDLAEAVRLYEA